MTSACIPAVAINIDNIYIRNESAMNGYDGVLRAMLDSQFSGLLAVCD